MEDLFAYFLFWRSSLVGETATLKLFKAKYLKNKAVEEQVVEAFQDLSLGRNYTSELLGRPIAHMPIKRETVYMVIFPLN